MKFNKSATLQIFANIFHINKLKNINRPLKVGVSNMGFNFFILRYDSLDRNRYKKKYQNKTKLKIK